MQRKQDEEIRSPQTIDNQTWNDCPVCGRSWKDRKATPGLIHRTRLCKKCEAKRDSIRKSKKGSRNPKEKVS